MLNPLILFYLNIKTYLDKMNLPQLYSTCSVHGLFENRRLVYKLRDAETTWKVRNRKMLTLKELPIESLMFNAYLPTFEIYIYKLCLLYSNVVNKYIRRRNYV